MKKKFFMTLVILLSISTAISKEMVVLLKVKTIGHEFKRDGLVLQVPSSGCTDRSYFSLDLQESVLSISKIRTDRCRAIIPLGTKVEFSYEELGLIKGDKVTITRTLSSYYRVP